DQDLAGGREAALQAVAVGEDERGVVGGGVRHADDGAGAVAERDGPGEVHGVRPRRGEAGQGVRHGRGGTVDDVEERGAAGVRGRGRVRGRGGGPGGDRGGRADAGQGQGGERDDERLSHVGVPSGDLGGRNPPDTHRIVMRIVSTGAPRGQGAVAG